MSKVFKLTRSFVIIISLCVSGKVLAQNASDLRINEFLVINNSNYQDDFGTHGAWIEIFNSAYNNVNIAGCYLTNDPKNPRKYRIPKNDIITNIAPRGYLVFWADAKTTHGTLHLNFDLKETNYLALYDQSGKVLIDSITFNHSAQRPDTSWGRLQDAGTTWGPLPKTTPRANNETVEPESAGSRFLKYDPSGILMAIMSMSVVFSSLLILYLVFKYVGKYNIKISNRAKKRELQKQGIQPSTSKESDGPTGEELAALSTALYLFENEKYDIESSILTIEKTARTYSPWSSKIYGLRQIPQKITRR